MNVLKELVKVFDFRGEYKCADRYGEGHINDTYLLETDNGEINKYIVQKMNSKIFDNVPQLMNNIYCVTSYLRDIVKENGGNCFREVLTVVKTKDGLPYFIDGEGSFWRAYLFIDNSVAYQIAVDAGMFRNAGKAFGTFIKNLNGFDAGVLHEIIPDFHNTLERYNQLERAVKLNKSNRAENVKNEIDFCLKRYKYCTSITAPLSEGLLPLRVTHNDTKLNNVLMDIQTNEAVCVIDLDTIMPGSLLYDFGDAIRSGCNKALEDERDINLVGFDINLFESFTEGFLGGIGAAITQKEMEMLPLSAIVMTYECGMRFLADHINGDDYFKVRYPQHNLVRARGQFKLVTDMENQLEDMKAIVAKYNAHK